MTYTPLRLSRIEPAKAAKPAKAEAIGSLGASAHFSDFSGLSGGRVQTANLAERAAIIEEGAKVPREWAEGFATLAVMPPPAGVDPTQWLAVVNAAGSFLDQWGGTAAALGWTAGELFGLDWNAPLNRQDRRGAAFFLQGAEVLAITANEISLRVGKDVLRLCRAARSGIAPWETVVWQSS